ncbi:MAG: TIM barrel protein [Candidatus Lokiarchaeota archaeon]|nr:TIM barrel protein [Candidatus Lokiarchaeota archaeon]
MKNLYFFSPLYIKRRIMENMDQLSIITDEICQNIEHVLDISQKYGIKDVELRKVWDKNIANFTDSDLKKLKKLLDERNMGVSMISGPFGKCVLPGSKYAKNNGESFSRNVEYNLGLFERLVEISDILETQNIRVFNFLKMGSEVNEESWKLMMDTIKPYVNKAESLNKVLMLENEHFCFLDTIKNTRRFFNEIDSNAIKLNLDPGNYYSAGEPTDTKAYEEFYENNWVGHVHVKDPKFKLPFIGGTFGVVGKGKIDYKSLFKQALRHDYDGYFSLETHVLIKKEKTSIRSLENISDMLKSL